MTPVRLTVTVKPNSKRPGVAVAGDSLEIRVAAPPQEGKANAAARDALAAALGLPRSAVVLVRGATGRRKTFEVGGLREDELRRRIAAVAGEGPRATATSR